MVSKVVVNESCHHIKLPLGELISKGRHAIAAVCDLFVYLGFRFLLEFAFTEARHLCAVIEGLPVRFWPMADIPILVINLSTE